MATFDVLTDRPVGFVSGYHWTDAYGHPEPYSSHLYTGSDDYWSSVTALNSFTVLEVSLA